MTGPPDPTVGVVISPSSAVVSPSELLRGFINEFCDRDIVPHGAVVGPANDDQQQAGVVSLMDAGNSKTERYVRILWKRVQVRCLAGELWRAEQIGTHMDDLLNEQRNLLLSDSMDRQWLVHQIGIAVGPSHHVDTPETHESLLFAEVVVGRDAVSIPTSD